MKNHRFYAMLATMLLCMFVLLSLGSAFSESLTFDEIVHIQEGKNAIQKHEFLIDTNNPPLIRELAVIPLVLKLDTYIHSPQPNMRALPARLVIIALGVLLGVSLYMAAYYWFGGEVALLSLFFYVFNPNILAHAHLVTQDIGASLFFFLAYMSLLWIMSERSWRSFIVHGIAMGLMASSKITTIPYYAATSLMVVPYVLHKELLTWFVKRPLHIIVSICIFAFVVWATYFFKTNVIVAPGNAQGRVSTTIKNIALKNNNALLLSGLTFLQKQPVPLGDFIAVLKNSAIRTTKDTKIFFMGRMYPKSLWYFMPVNLFYKTSLVLLFLAMVGIYTLYHVKKQKGNMLRVLFPVVAIVFVSSVSGIQPLARYALPMYPFLFILAGASISVIKNTIGRTLLLCLCVFYLLQSLSLYPHFMTYANEVAQYQDIRIKLFTDSNMDWGQSLISFQKYIDTKKPASIRFSYFGRDDASLYGMPSDFPYASYKFNEICAFHDIYYPKNSGRSVTAISISNWWACGYNLDPTYAIDKASDIVAESIIVY